MRSSRLSSSYLPSCMVSIRAALCACSLLCSFDAFAQKPVVTVWLIPSEPAVDNPGAPGTCDQRDAAALAMRYGPTKSVELVNISQPSLRDQFEAVNPEFATTNGAMVAGQCETLAALERFAGSRFQIRVRFVSWGQASEEAKQLRGVNRAGEPDLMQVGSTWLGTLAARDADAPSSPMANELWYAVDERPIALKYVADHRLLFYWKRLPSESPDAPAFRIDDSSWDTILRSLQRQESAAVRPLVLPAGLTVNVLNDYLPLVLAGGGAFIEPSWGGRFSRANLTSDGALAVPLMLAATARQSTSSGRLVAFPEMPHEEAAQHFIRAEYRAIIEPVAFVQRWHQAFMAGEAAKRVAEAPAGSFWDYAAVAVPPSSFKGGSALMVVKGTAQATLAADLARFLTTDQQYTRTLVKYGQLPAHNVSSSVDAIANILGVDTDSEWRTAFLDAVQRSASSSREAPALAQWAILESTEVLEAIQRLWRRIAEGDDARVIASAAALEQTVDRQIFTPMVIWTGIEPALPLIAAVLLVVAVIVIGALVIALRKAGEAAQSNRIRGFASIGLAKLDRGHSFLHNKYSPWDANSEVGKKSALVMSTLEGWKRGMDAKEWRDASLSLVVWRAILLAIDSVYVAGVSEGCRKRFGDTPNASSIEEYLRQYLIPGIRVPGLLRDQAVPGDDGPPFHFSVECPAGLLVTSPFMLEQALACLIQNAIEASQLKLATFKSIQIHYDRQMHAVAVSNEGMPIAAEVREALSPVHSIEEFKTAVSALLPRGEPTTQSTGIASIDTVQQGADSRGAPQRIGVGLVEAYCIARQCYRGLWVAPNEPRVAIRLP